MSVITLTTDFGLEDWFVGAMKGVITSMAPRAKVVDICHGIPAGDIRAGAFALAAAFHCFPKGTIHVVVVDPGVGSARPAIAATANGHHFAGPDNGVLSLALSATARPRVRRLEDARWFRQPVSQTFHGRDVFAPVAAHLSRGIRLSRLGPVAPDWKRIDLAEPVREDKTLKGEIVYVDRFGNAITNIPNDWIGGKPMWIQRGRRRLAPVKSCYADVPPGSPVAVPGSTGYLEVAVNGGNAARKFRLRPGVRVEICR